jgi:UPF0755 protein
MKKSFTFSIITSFFTIFLMIFSLILVNIYLLFSPINMSENKNGIVFYLKPNMSKEIVLNKLIKENIISSRLLGYEALLLQVFTSKKLFKPIQLKTGEYFFKPNSTLFSIFKQMTQGTGLFYRRFTLVPGWSFQQLREALLKTDMLHHIINRYSDKELMHYLGRPEFLPEGWFFPETYYYSRDTEDLIILKRAFDLMQKKLQLAWENRSAQLPFNSPYEVLIAASLIEKEAYLNNERPIIAGVIINRLRKNMLLQIDPTVIYGMNQTGYQQQGKLYQSDLRKDTIYNTYIHKGLPPTPIAMPGMASIEAALHPAEHQYLYFVARGDGSHQFSVTLPEHHIAVDMSKKMSKKTTYFFNKSIIYKYINI